MSRYNRPMRRYDVEQFGKLECRHCGAALRVGQFGGWEHVRPLAHRDWHRAEVK